MSGFAFLLRRTTSSSSASDLEESYRASEPSSPVRTVGRSSLRHRLEIRIAAFEEACRSCNGEPTSATFFHSSVLPTTPVSRLADVIVSGMRKYAVTHETVAWALVLIERYAAVAIVSPLMMHRLFVCALWIAIKLHCDVPPSASRMTKLCGIASWELARMEREFVSAVQFKLHADAADISAMLKAL